MDVNLLGLYQSLSGISGLSSSSLNSISSLTGVNSTSLGSLLGTDSTEDTSSIGTSDFASVLNMMVDGQNNKIDTEELSEAITDAVEKVTGTSQGTVSTTDTEKTVSETEKPESSPQDLYTYFQNQNATLGGVEQVLSGIDNGTIEEMIEGQIADSLGNL